MRRKRPAAIAAIMMMLALMLMPSAIWAGENTGDSAGASGNPESVSAASGNSESVSAASASSGNPEAQLVVTDDPEKAALTIQEDLPGEDVESVLSEQPFLFRRLAVFAEEGALTDSCGALSVTYFTPGGDYLLDYESEEAAELAYRELVKSFGTSAVLPDLPICTESEAYTETAALSHSWGIDRMHLDEVRDLSEQDPELDRTVTAAILDTGMYPEHELFEGRVEDAVSFIGDREYSEDESGHGTHVAGIVADGTSSQVRILPIKVLASENGLGGYAEMINGIYYAIEQHADVINMSFASSGAEYGSYIGTAEAKADEALRAANAAGIVCVAAAGNDNRNLNVLKTYPAMSPYTVTVSSIKQDMSRAGSSNYGESVDFTAPGDSISSAGTLSRGSYVVKSGTSMAAPHITAAFAMLKLYNPDGTPEELIDLLASAALDFGAQGKDKLYGIGLPVFENGTVPVMEKEKEKEGEQEEEPPGDTDKSGQSDQSGSTGQSGQSSGSGDTGKSGQSDQSGSTEQGSSGKTDDGKADAGRSSGGMTTLRSGDVKLAQTVFTWSGRAKKPAVTVSLNGRRLTRGTDYMVTYQNNVKVGTAAAVIQGKGAYAGTIRKSFTIRPKGTVLKTLRAGRKKLTVRWAKRTGQVTGYQIRYAADRNFRKGVKTLTVKKPGTTRRVVAHLKSGKRYYVKVRTYRKTGGKTYYSGWSNRKSVVTK